MPTLEQRLGVGTGLDSGPKPFYEITILDTTSTEGGFLGEPIVFRISPASFMSVVMNDSLDDLMTAVAASMVAFSSTNQLVSIKKIYVMETDL